MSGFSYFLPNETASNLGVPARWMKARAKHGLDEALSDVRDPKQLERRDVTGGPSGQPGCIICCLRNDGEEPGAIGYFKDRQTWAPTFGSAWIGYSELPRPEWLKRATPDLGQWKTDPLGRTWLIPIARMPDHTYGTLPKQYDFDERGRATATLRGNAVGLWEISGRVWDAMNNVEGRDMSMTEFAEAAMKAVAWNYRLGPCELRAFSQAGEPIIDDTTTIMFCMALVHNDVAALRTPKNDETPTGSSSSLGPKEETPAGDLVEAS